MHRGHYARHVENSYKCTFLRDREDVIRKRKYLSCTAGSDGDRSRGASSLIQGGEEEIARSMARTGQGPKEPHVSPLYKLYKPGFDILGCGDT